MGDFEKVPEAVIRRMPKYYRYLTEKKRSREVRVSSSQMSKDMGLNASQIRRDLNVFGGFGQQGYGYSVERLLSEIETILGLDKRHDAIIVGAGHIGTALAGYKNFEVHGFFVNAVFDIDPGRVGTKVGGIKVFHMDELLEYTKKKHIDIAMLCTPKEAAQTAAERIEQAGIGAIWNFAPIEIDVAPGIAIENMRMNDSLYVLSYRMQCR